MIPIFALLSAICFFAAAIGPDAWGPVNLIWLGAALLALHFAFGVGIPWARQP